jgi:cation diffusion facilitator CzcD-associated flavoprotein CzcO
VNQEQVVVVGAGAAGLAVAAMLKRRDVEPLVLERTDKVASSWRSRYDSLRLNTPRITSTLAGYRMPRRYGRWPVRDDVIEYLEEYAHRHELRIQFEAELSRVERANDGTVAQEGNVSGAARWLLKTSRGEIATRFVVIATGHDAEPKLPNWPGQDEFAGELIHSAVYANPEPFRGQDVLVVSARNTGTEIAYELATHGGCRVWTSMRTPPSVFPREWPRGFPLNYSTVLLDPLPNAVLDQVGFLTQRLIYGNLARYGIPRAPLGVQSATKKRHVSALIDAGFIQALKDGKLELVAAVERFDGSKVVLADGSVLQPQTVIAATGYNRNLPQIVGHLGVLDEYGVPALNGELIRAREHPNAPGLFFTGYYASTAGQLRFMRIDGRRIARAIARQLASAS